MLAVGRGQLAHASAPARRRPRSPRARLRIASRTAPSSPIGPRCAPRPGDGEQRLVGAAAEHRLGAESVATAYDHADQRHLQPGAGDQQPRGVPHQRRWPPRRGRPSSRGCRPGTRPGTPNESHSCRNRAALSAASLVIAPAMCRDWLATKPDRPALDAAERGDQLRREPLAEERHAALVGQRADHRPHVERLPLALGHRVPQRAPGRAPSTRRRRPGSSRAASCDLRPPPPRPRPRRRRTPLRVCTSIGPISSGAKLPEPAAGDHRRPGHAEVGVRGWRR